MGIKSLSGIFRTGIFILSSRETKVQPPNIVLIMTDVLTNSALTFIEKNRDTPLLCSVQYAAWTISNS